MLHLISFIEGFEMEGTLKFIQFHPPAMGRDTPFTRPGCSLSNLTWNTPTDVACTALYSSLYSKSQSWLPTKLQKLQRNST